MGEGMLTRIAVTAAYAAQGFGYAAVVTSLPALKARQGVDDTVVTIVVLGICVTAALGSMLADIVAVRRGSRSALVVGLALQAVALALVAMPMAPWVFFAAFALYGTGLGCVDAASAMQGVSVQRRHGSPLLGGFFAGYTAAAIVGALAVAALSAISPAPTSTALGLAAVLALAVAAVGTRLFAAGRADGASAADRGPLPRRVIWVFGAVLLVAFVTDSAVSTWSTIYLHDDLSAAAWLAPLGYGAYQAAVLVARLATDPLARRVGARILVAAAIAVAAAGCAIVALVPVPGAAVTGFALAGVSTGVLVPVAFSAAGDADPAHSDEIVARVNIFTYAGAVVGAVGVGVLADGPGLAAGFLVPGIALVALLATVRAFGPRRASAPGPSASAR